MFLGREQELRSLGELLDKPTASLVACRGRRRIGKSTLFKEFSHRRQIDAGIIDDVKEKVRALRKPRGMSIRTGVIYEGELSPSVKRSGYFDALVDIGRFMRGMR